MLIDTYVFNNTYFIQFLFRRKSKSVNRISPSVRPLTKFLRCFRERHVRCYCTVYDGLKQVHIENAIECTVINLLTPSKRTLLPSTLMMRYNARWESKKKETFTATVDADIHDFFVLGSMWNTCALHVNIGCSLSVEQYSIL